MGLPQWIMYPALATGLAGMACAILGTRYKNKLAVLIGHFIVSAHLLMYFVASLGDLWHWGLAAFAFLVAGIIYDKKASGWRRRLWLCLAIPSGAFYLLNMGIWVLYITSMGP